MRSQREDPCRSSPAASWVKNEEERRLFSVRLWSRWTEQVRILPPVGARPSPRSENLSARIWVVSTPIRGRKGKRKEGGTTRVPATFGARDNG
ncbi:hypothetical protein NL676_003041 [Syzygium grande]|nr:hypothetical protein NL676_003041 [Syzygium grande]